MNKIEELLLDILRTIIHDLPLDAVRFMDVTKEEWAELYRLSKAQGVTAVVFDKLSRAYSESEEFPRPPKEQTLKWYAQSMAIEKKMSKIRSLSAEFAERMAEEGLHTLVLKGIAISTYYPNPLHREFGDLDCYLFEKSCSKIIWNNAYEKGNIAAEIAGADVRRGFYKHSHIKFKNFEIENHQFSLPIKDGKSTRELERHLRKIAIPIKLEEEKELYIPSADFNALFLTAHAMNHFLYESIKIRNVLDWALFVRKERENVDWKSFWEWCDKMHYTRFVECLNFICEKYLGVNAMVYNRTSSAKSLSYDKEKMATRILQDVFHGNSIYTKGYGYFGFRFALAMSYFKSLWKFQEVYQHNALWLLCKRAWGMTIKEVRL